MCILNIKEINESEAKDCFLLDSKSLKLWSLAQWKIELKKKDIQAIALYIEKKFIGVCVFQFIFDEANIHFIAILPQFTKRGYGKMLFTKFLNISKNNNIKKIFLEVSSKNFPAIQFYESFNFITVGIRKKYYKDASDAILKTKIIC